MMGNIWLFVAVHFWAFAGAFGALGAVLLVVAFIVFGWQITAVFVAVANLAREAIAFFETPLGEALGIIMLLVAVATIVDVHQIRVDNAAYEVKLNAALTAAAKKADEDRKARDEYVKQQVGADADKRIAQIEAEKADLEQKARDYDASLSNDARNRCAVAPGDLPVRLQDGRRRH